MYAILAKYRLSFSLIFFSIIFWVTFLPFFVYIPVPGIGWDTYGYFWFAEKILASNLPVTDAPIDLPVGYPIFLAFCKIFSLNIIHIAFVQVFMFFIVNLFLIYQSKNLFKYATPITAIAMCLYILQPLIIRNTIVLYPDTLYSSALIFLTAALFRYYNKRDNFSFLLVLIGVLLSILIRSNGILLYYIPVLIIALSFKNLTLLKRHLAGFIVMLVFLSSINYVTKGYFFPAEKSRLHNVSKSVGKSLVNKESNKKYIGKTDTSKTGSIVQIIDISETGRTSVLILDTTETGRPISQIRYTQTKKEMFKEYFKLFSRIKPSFYYSFMPSLYEGRILGKGPETDWAVFDGYYYIDDLSSSLRAFIYSGYDYKKYDDKKYSDIINYQVRNKNYLMMTSHLLYQIIQKTKINYIIQAFFWILLFYYIYVVIRKKDNKDLCIYLLIMSCIYIIHITALPIIHGRVQERYLFVTEFTVYLSVFLGGYIVLANKFKKCSTTKP